MEPETVLTIWKQAAEPALRRAGQALADLTGLPFALEDQWVGLLPWNQFVAELAAEHPVPLYVVTLSAQGLFKAQIWLVFTETNGRDLVTAMVGAPPPHPLDAMGQSALAEVGNVVGTAFLNVFADRFFTAWEPSPPTVHYVARGWLEEQTAGDSLVLITDARFQVTGTRVKGELVVLPTPLSDRSP